MIARLRPLIAALAVIGLFSNFAQADDRRIGLAIADLSQRPYGEGVTKAKAVGVSYTSIPLHWDEIEKTPDVYTFEPDWLSIASLYYPFIEWHIALELNPIDTVADRRPAWLKSKSWDHPDVLAAYNKLADEVVLRTQTLDMVSFAIGNEIDGLLQSNQVQWRSYSAFVLGAAKHIKAKRPLLKVGAKITFAGVVANRDAQALARELGLALVTYYPLDQDFKVRAAETARFDFAAMVKLLPNVEIQLAEIGYPSTAACGTGEAGQAQFVREAFKAWDTYAPQMTAMNWTWMTDVSETQTAAAAAYYGVDKSCFTEFFATLCLETRDLNEKPSWTAFAAEAKKHMN